MIDIIMLVLNALFGFYGIYTLGVIVLGMGKKHVQYEKVIPKKRIAVVIAARNEEAVIGACVETLLKQDYPSEMYDVWVIPNNCTDGTDFAARRAGASILECTVPVASKGDVLEFAFARLSDMNAYDAYCIFDADNLVDPQFLTVANDALCAGVKVGQGYRDSKNPHESWIAGDMSIFHWMMAHLFNRGRSALGMSAMLSGTGIVIAADVMREHGWHTVSLTEDLEFTAQCTLYGIKIAWLHDAILYDEQPNNLTDSFKQRRRWFAGTLQCLKKYGAQLWRKAVRERDFQSLDFAMFFAASVTQMICILPGAVSFLLLMLRALNTGGIVRVLIECGGMLTLFFAGTCAAAAIICALVGKPTARMGAAIANFWLFLVTWAGANFAAIAFGAKWEEIAHTSKAQLPVDSPEVEAYVAKKKVV